MIVIKQFVFYATTMLLTLQEWVSALVSHAAGTKHKERLRTYNPISSLCFMNVNKYTPKATSTPQVDSLMSSVVVSHAEIYWAMKVLGHTFHIIHV